MADKSRPKARSGSVGGLTTFSPSNNGSLSRSNDDLHYDVHKYLDQFWPYQTEKIDKMSPIEFRDPKISQELPLARIKKIMKLDEDVKTQMISAEAPVLFAKACEMFIEELTIRAWVHTEDNKRKTLQKNDIAMAISKHDQFDFLIDIVPREEIMKSGGSGGTSGASPAAKRRSDFAFQTGPSPGTSHVESHVPMFVQVATPASSGMVAQPAVQAIQLQNGQIVQAQTLGGGQAMQLVQGANGELQLVSIGGNTQQVATQVLHATPITQHQQQQQHQQDTSNAQSSSSFAQAFQQIVAPDGTIHHLPIQLSPAQMNYLKHHLNSGGGQQQVHIIQNSGTPVTSQAVTMRAQVQQQQQPTAFFVQTSGPMGQGQQQHGGGIQLQMVTTEHQGSDTATTSAT